MKRFLLSLAVLPLVLVGCNDKDPAKCEQARSTVRQALAGKNIQSAQDWRAYAYKHCESASELSALDQEIVSKRAAWEAEARAAAAAKAAQAQLLTLFSQWVSTSRTKPEASVSPVVCDSPDDAQLKASKERFCGGTRSVAGGDAAVSFAVRYWEKSPTDQARFSVRSPRPTRCEELGGARLIKELAAPAVGGGSVKRFHCEMTDGALAGLQVLATDAPGAELVAFTPKYLEKDTAFAAQLR